MAIIEGSLAFHAREKHWIRNDRLSRIEPGIPAASRHQFEAAEALRTALFASSLSPFPSGATYRSTHALKS